MVAGAALGSAKEKAEERPERKKRLRKRGLNTVLRLLSESPPFHIVAQFHPALSLAVTEQV